MASIESDSRSKHRRRKPDLVIFTPTQKKKNFVTNPENLNILIILLFMHILNHICVGSMFLMKRRHLTRSCASNPESSLRQVDRFWCYPVADPEGVCGACNHPLNFQKKSDHVRCDMCSCPIILVYGQPFSHVILIY